ncbi:class I SAM-dependent methyltransferase [Paracraurococcus lichenis]|uniref:Class I SAM-dependent methyltransferase n=1 Tax=Paracraurococcus lichenis TaxID=3064888 RepID=A0ABT9DUE6_9PROT|nr:class I SAM-dependent methyltransferase [Paracraurococcus sp. LOR1-02]MDO9707522.1 class I SAM-dependent methyltransferase [Paracraurococcus sp. LOR1-02]
MPDTAILPQPATMPGTEPTPDAILQLGFAFWQSKTLLSAVELGLFTLLDEAGPLPAAAVGARLGLHPRALSDFLDALVALGMLGRDAAGRYGNTPATARYLVRSRPGYVGGMLEMANARLYPYWGRLTDGLRTGLPQNEIRDGQPGIFETLYADPAALEGFLQAMTGLSRPNARAMAEAFPWGEHASVADIGCAQGGCLAEILRAHPHLRGIGYDLPQVRPVFEDFARGQGLQDRMRFTAGDFFADPLPQAEVLVMGHILHDWDLEAKRMLLRKAHAALPPGGALVVYDAMIDDDRRENAFGLLMSLNMLVETPGGFDYTGSDCAGWMEEAGFRAVRVRHLQGPYAMAVGIR